MILVNPERKKSLTASGYERRERGGSFNCIVTIGRERISQDPWFGFNNLGIRLLRKVLK